MAIINAIRLILGLLLILGGTIVFILEITGVYKFHYILNRMHFAGTGDTMGLAFVLLGAAIVNGFEFGSIKLLLVLVFFWFASPVSSHLISRLVMETDEEIDKHVRILDETESEKLMHPKEEEK